MRRLPSRDLRITSHCSSTLWGCVTIKSISTGSIYPILMRPSVSLMKTGKHSSPNNDWSITNFFIRFLSLLTRQKSSNISCKSGSPSAMGLVFRPRIWSRFITNARLAIPLDWYNVQTVSSIWSWDSWVKSLSPLAVWRR